MNNWISILDIIILINCSCVYVGKSGLKNSLFCDFILVTGVMMGRERGQLGL